MFLPSVPCKQRRRAVKKADCVVGKTCCEAHEESAVSCVCAHARVLKEIWQWEECTPGLSSGTGLETPVKTTSCVERGLHSLPRNGSVLDVSGKFCFSQPQRWLRVSDALYGEALDSPVGCDTMIQRRYIPAPAEALKFLIISRSLGFWSCLWTQPLGCFSTARSKRE